MAAPLAMPDFGIAVFGGAFAGWWLAVLVVAAFSGLVGNRIGVGREVAAAEGRKPKSKNYPRPGEHALFSMHLFDARCRRGIAGRVRAAGGPPHAGLFGCLHRNAVPKFLKPYAMGGAIVPSSVFAGIPAPG